MSGFCRTRLLMRLSRRPALIGELLLKLLHLALRLLLAGALLLLLRLLRCIAFSRSPCIGRCDQHASISWLLIALQFILAAWRRLLLLCLLPLSLLAQHALLAQGFFRLPTLLVMLELLFLGLSAHQFLLLLCLLPPDPLIGLWCVVLGYGNLQGAHGGLLNGGRRRSGRNGRGKLALRCGVVALKAAWARVIRPLIFTMWRTEKRPPVVAMLALAAHHGLRCHAGGRQLSWLW